MQPTIISLFLLLLVAGATTSCDKDEPDGKSIFVDPAEEKTEFDFWLDRHYTEPYNIRFEYRMPDRETHFNYWVSPPPVDKSIEVAKLIKYSTLDAMAELMSDQKDPLLFAKSYFPRVLYLVGSFEISSTGNTVLASAENGLQINVLGVKFFDREKDSERIAGTMLHEFMHILDGTYPVPSDYDTITQSDYVGDKYAQSGNDYMGLRFEVCTFESRRGHRRNGRTPDQHERGGVGGDALLDRKRGRPRQNREEALDSHRMAPRRFWRGRCEVERHLPAPSFRTRRHRLDKS